MAIPLVVIVGMIPKRPAAMIESGISQRQLYELKLNWKSEFDMVLAGNSRVTVGLAPGEMSAALPGLRIANFGFDGNGFTPEYLDALEATFRPGSGERIVVLGITPITLTERAARQNGFSEERLRSADERFLARHLPWVLDFFARFNPRMALVLLRGDDIGRELWHGYPDGWAAQDMQPADLDGQVRFLRVNVRDGAFPVSPRIVSNLLTTVQKWRQAGITTFAFLPPVTAELAREEIRATGFVLPEFVKGFTAMGGHWLEVPSEVYLTYDGGHLEEESARRLSRDIATEIARRVRAAPTTSHPHGH
ncbi:MAG: hypothetical protein HYV95_02995 [Opitutae bacterium]|nr:hypothetical protein [Opitutae bacterium]